MEGRWVYEGVIDDPYGEFLIEENKTLEKVLLSITFILLMGLVK